MGDRGRQQISGVCRSAKVPNWRAVSHPSLEVMIHPWRRDGLRSHRRTAAARYVHAWWSLQAPGPGVQPPASVESRVHHASHHVTQPPLPIDPTNPMRGRPTRRAAPPRVRVREAPNPHAPSRRPAVPSRHGPLIKPRHASGQDLTGSAPKVRTQKSCVHRSRLTCRITSPIPRRPLALSRLPRHATRLPLVLGPRAATAGGTPRARGRGHGHGVPGPGHHDEPRLRLRLARGSRAALARKHAAGRRDDGARRAAQGRAGVGGRSGGGGRAGARRAGGAGGGGHHGGGRGAPAHRLRPPRAHLRGELAGLP
jgi:hypothetical protein